MSQSACTAIMPNAWFRTWLLSSRRGASGSVCLKHPVPSPHDADLSRVRRGPGRPRPCSRDGQQQEALRLSVVRAAIRERRVRDAFRGRPLTSPTAKPCGRRVPSVSSVEATHSPTTNNRACGALTTKPNAAPYVVTSPEGLEVDLTIGLVNVGLMLLVKLERDCKDPRAVLRE